MRDDARNPTSPRKRLATPAASTRGRASALRPVTVALGLAALGLAGFLLVPHLRSATAPSQRALARAVAHYRVVRPRLSGGFEHAPCARDHDPRLVTGLVCGDPRPAPPAALLRFATGFAREIGAADSGEAAHVRGAFGLLWPEQDGSVDRALADLRRAAAARPHRADVQSDLAAALLVRAEAAQDPASLVAAYRAADSALALDRTLPEARFNRALALEWLYLDSDAAEAWRAYLDLDARSPWAREARAHLERLTRPPPDSRALLTRLRELVSHGDSAGVEELVGRYPWIARRAAVEDALGAWARARRDGRAHEADSSLRFARAVGAALGRVTGNTLLREAVAAIDAARAAGDTARLARLEAGQIALAEGTGYLDLERVDLSAAAERLEAARDLLGRARSPMAGWATYRRAEAWYQGTSVASDERALELLSTIVTDAPAGHCALRARAAQVMGLLHDIRASYDPALAAYDVAVAAADLAREVELGARVRGWRSQILSALRGRRAAWQDLYGALASTRDLFDAPRSRWSVLRDVVREIAAEAPDLALLFQGEVVRAARLDAPAAAVAALAQRAALLTAAGELAQAAREIEEADRLARAVDDRGIRAVQLAVVDLARGQLGIAVDPAGGIAALRRTLATYRATGEYFGRASANLYLAEAYLARDDVDSAESALRAATAEMERRRNRVKGYHERAAFLDHARPVLDRILRFYADRRDPLVAFDFFERTRARVLLERLEAERPPEAPGVRGSLSSREIRSNLPPGTAVITYAVVGDELLAWVLRDDRIRLTRTAVAASELETLVGRLERAILERAAPEQRRISAALYDRIIRPILGEVDAGDRLVVVPDRWLHFVPFAALWDAERGEYLIEQHEISFAPSASLVVARAAGLAPRRPEADLVLAIGNPAFDRRSFSLPDLPGAAREADSVARTHARARVLVGAAATKPAFLSAAANVGIIHFAGHAVVRPDAPLLSHLVLAPTAGDGGALYAREIFDLQLRRARLAVLSGCHTSGGYLSGTEGVSSLARAFLAAGVPVVVASLWAVEDRETAEFFAEFHRRVAAGEVPAAALRATQVAWIRSARPRQGVRTWAAFQAYGAVSPT